MLFRKRLDRLRDDVEVLRLRIDSETLDAPIHSIGVVGLSLGVGTTTVAFLLAASYARQGRKVRMVDADREHARLDRLLKVRPAPGVAEVLGGRCPLQDAIQESEHRGIAVVSAGAAHAVQSASHKAWRALLHHLSKEERLVIVDAGPLDSADALASSSACDGVIVVIEAGVSRREAVRAAVERLRVHGARPLGVVLNKRRYPIPGIFYRGT